MLLGEFPSWFYLSFAIAIGGCVGSFLNVVVYRWPRGINLAHPPSTCPTCQKPIALYWNLPVVGWLALRGRSACCKNKISPRYPIVELIGALLAWALVVFRLEPIAHVLPLGEALVFFFSEYLMAAALVAAAIIDWEEMLIPSQIPLVGYVVGVASAFYRPEVTWLTALCAGAGAAFCIWLPFVWLYKKFRGIEGMGLGDVYLMLVAGAFFGPFGAFFTLFSAAIQGTLFWAISYLLGVKAHEPVGVTRQRQELLEAIEAAEGEEKEELQTYLANDPMGQSPEEYEGSPRVAFGPFLSLAMLELFLFYDDLRGWAWLFLGL